MASISKSELTALITQTGIIPIFSHHDIEVSKSVIATFHKSGVKIFEYTHKGDNAFNNFVQLKKYADTNLRGMILGVGSIITARMAIEYIKAGADFISSPVFKKDIANECNKAYKYFIPGCATPTEIIEASELGAEIISIFPAETIGPKFVANVMTKISGLKLMPSGGVENTEDSIERWFKAGVVCLAMGTQLIKKNIIDTKDYATLEQNIKSSVAIISQKKLMYNM